MAKFARVFCHPSVFPAQMFFSVQYLPQILNQYIKHSMHLRPYMPSFICAHAILFIYAYKCIYIMLSIFCVGIMADSRNNYGSTVNDIYETVLSLSEKMKSYYHCKSSACLLTEIKHELQSINQNLKERFTQQEKEVFAVLVVTTPEIMKSYVSFADTLFSGNLSHKC